MSENYFLKIHTDYHNPLVHLSMLATLYFHSTFVNIILIFSGTFYVCEHCLRLCMSMCLHVVTPYLNHKNITPY